MRSVMSDIYYDPYDFEIDDDPYPIWKRMRDETPLYRNDRSPSGANIPRTI